MAEMKKVPDIRFKGFNEVWDEKNLSEIATMKARIGWQGLTKKEYLESGNFYLITGTDFLDGRIDFKNCHYVNEDRYAQDVNIQIKNDDVLITKDGTIGKVAYVDNLDKPATLNAGVFVIRGKDKSICNLYLYQYLAAPYLLDFAYKQATGGTIKHLNQNVLVKFPVPISNVNEQKHIGGYFQRLDKLISLHQTKVNKLTNLKKAMLEKMFPKQGADEPEIRFKGFEGAWERKRFGDCVLIQRGGSPRPIENFITNDENGINWIKIGDVSTTSRYITKTKEKIIPAGEKHSRRVYEGDLILSNSMSFGRPYIMAIEGCIHDGWLVIRDENKQFNLEYLLQLLSSDFMLKQYKALASGGVVINLNSELVKSTTVYIPTLDEQEKIGAYFQNLDKTIALHQTELEKLNNLKKACLEKMFV